MVLDGRASFVELLSAELLPIPDEEGGDDASSGGEEYYGVLKEADAAAEAASSKKTYVLSPNAEDTRMTIASVPPDGPFLLKFVTRFDPGANLELSGLYKSSGTFCTQCEAEGFRMITYYPDRPDVLSTFRVAIRADKAKYPVLLSNGNCEKPPTPYTREKNDSNVTNDEQHTSVVETVWHDPWPKPCYLFALVAGDLARVSDSFVTKSGRSVALHIYAQKKNIDRCDFAMQSLKRAMRWDETRFGLEYDLDLFNVVAVDDFNMGAMENKSLNIFNSRLVLATPESATDAAFARIEGVIGHEYFHNWSGNRVTCRDWFQLSLKEGLTVFRDQEFSADVNGRGNGVKRIGDARFLRDAQFAEDAGPMAHPVRPASYMKIDNFYTLTVYEKGAEVIRMYHTLLGEAGFRRGTDVYFSRHDGAAVTCDDFFDAMRDANPGARIENLKLWYSQAGTPTVTVERLYDETAGRFAFTVTQALPVTPDEHGAEPKRPQLVPVAVGLIGPDGEDADLTGVKIEVTEEENTGEGGGEENPKHPPRSSVSLTADGRGAVLRLEAFRATFAFEGAALKKKGEDFSGGFVPSVLRGFSAPVKLKLSPDLTVAERLFQLANDSDAFNRWEAAQTLARGVMKDFATRPETKDRSRSDLLEAVAADATFAAFAKEGAAIIRAAAEGDASVDRAWTEEAFTFPGVASLAQELAPVDPLLLHDVAGAFVEAFARACRAELAFALETCRAEALADRSGYQVNPAQTSRRALAGFATRLLGVLGDDESVDWAEAYDAATNMTETTAVLSALAKHPNAGAARRRAFQAFHEKWKDDANVVCTYFSLVAASVRDVFEGGDEKEEEGEEGDAGERTSWTPLENVKRALSLPSYDPKLPNKFYALIGGFARSNPRAFHASDGSGYRFLADRLMEMDALNPQAAARIAKPFTEWRLYDEKRRGMIKAEIRRVLDAEPSPNMYEIMSKSLNGGEE